MQGSTSKWPAIMPWANNTELCRLASREVACVSRAGFRIRELNPGHWARPERTNVGRVWKHETSLTSGERQSRVRTLPGCRFPQPPGGLFLIHWHSIAIPITQAEIVLSRGVAFTSRSRYPSSSGCAALCKPASDLVSHSHL